MVVGSDSSIPNALIYMYTNRKIDDLSIWSIFLLEILKYFVLF